MAEPTGKTAEEIAEEERLAQEEQDNELSKKSAAELAKELKSTRAEARERRLKEKELNEKIKSIQVESDKIQAQITKDKETKLKADGKLQELLTSKEKELEEAMSFKEKYETLEKEKLEIEEEIRKDLTQGLSKEQKEFCNDKTISDIRKFVKLIGVNKGNDMDKGGKMAGNSDVKLSDSNKKEAGIMGLSESAYYEIQMERKQRKENLKNKLKV